MARLVEQVLTNQQVPALNLGHAPLSLPYIFFPATGIQTHLMAAMYDEIIETILWNAL